MDYLRDLFTYNSPLKALGFVCWFLIGLGEVFGKAWGGFGGTLEDVSGAFGGIVWTLLGKCWGGLWKEKRQFQGAARVRRLPSA